MNKTKIDWATMSWNPVTGCRHGCPYCYARRTATRFNAGLEDPAPLAASLRAHNKDGRGAEDADELMADIMLACMALHHVAEFATDKCRFVPLPGKNGG